MVGNNQLDVVALGVRFDFLHEQIEIIMRASPHTVGYAFRKVGDGCFVGINASGVKGGDRPAERSTRSRKGRSTVAFQ